MNTTTMSEQIGELFAALSRAQAEIEGAAKDSINPHFRSKYADLASVWSACKPALTRHGLCVVQIAENENPDVATVVTVLGHSSGQWIKGKLTMSPVKTDPQGMGSAITYARRYSLAAMVGVAPEDDDGNAASAKESNLPPPTEDRLGEVMKALDTDDGWLLLKLTAEDSTAYRAAFGRLNSKQKALCRDLEQRCASARLNYIDAIKTMAEADDEMGVQQLLSELKARPLAKQLVWAQLDRAARDYIKGLQEPA